MKVNHIMMRPVNLVSCSHLNKQNNPSFKAFEMEEEHYNDIMMSDWLSTKEKLTVLEAIKKAKPRLNELNAKTYVACVNSPKRNFWQRLTDFPPILPQHILLSVMAKDAEGKDCFGRIHLASDLSKGISVNALAKKMVEGAKKQIDEISHHVSWPSDYEYQPESSGWDLTDAYIP